MDNGSFIYKDFDTDQVSFIISRLHDLYAKVYAEPPYYEGPAEVANFVTRFEDQRREVGFSLASCWSDRQLLGYLYGFTLTPECGWWNSVLTRVCSGRSFEEVRKRTAFISELLVRADVRTHGIGRTLHDRFLASRAESQALLLVHPNAHVGRIAYAKWGWRKVGYGVPFPGAGSYETLVLFR
jgi:hypothetical protein